MNLDNRAASDLLRQLLVDHEQAAKLPVLGAQLKLAMISKARELGLTFDEKHLGHKCFSSFLVSTGLVTLQQQQGSDMLVFLSTTGASSPRRGRIREHFWRAFLTFPIQ